MGEGVIVEIDESGPIAAGGQPGNQLSDLLVRQTDIEETTVDSDRTERADEPKRIRSGMRSAIREDDRAASAGDRVGDGGHEPARVTKFEGERLARWQRIEERSQAVEIAGEAGRQLEEERATRGTEFLRLWPGTFPAPARHQPSDGRA